MQSCAVRWAVTLGDPSERRPSGAPFANALDALAWAARAWVLRCGHQASIWELTVAICGGGLLHGRPRDPPGY